MTLEPLTDTRAILGEGPVWHNDQLIWVDIEGRKVFIHDPETKQDHAIQLRERVGCVRPCAGDDRLVCGLQSGLAFLDLKSGGLTAISDPEADLPTRFNDGNCDPLGRFWAGTMDMDEKEAIGSLYMLDSSQKVTRQWQNVTVSNGLAWDPDGVTLYYNDSPTREVAAFDYDAATGTITNRRVAVPIPDGEGFPDGMTIDREGMLWIALWQGWGVVRYNPRTGERLQKIELPVEKVTSCMFGGANLDDLYITTAQIHLSDEAHAQQPFAGGLFKVNPGVCGLKSVPYLD